MNNRKLGLIAGGGMLPFEIITHCQKTQREIFVVGLESFVTPEYLDSVPHIYAKLGEVGKILKKRKQIKEKTLQDGKKSYQQSQLLTKKTLTLHQ